MSKPIEFDYIATKTCKTCGLSKTLDCFSLHPNGDGLRNKCKKCRALQEQKNYLYGDRAEKLKKINNWKSQNREKVLKYKRKSDAARRKREKLNKLLSLINFHS